MLSKMFIDSQNGTCPNFSMAYERLALTVSPNRDTGDETGSYH
ncbi:MAG: hypothetical protein ACTS73_02930 [Arsenophonus sp. NEOnobi-MAG3]